VIKEITYDGYYNSIIWFKDKKKALDQYEKDKERGNSPTLVKIIK
jgi:hypothetical protein